MPRNIVLCLDGTHNEFAASHTNVLRLYRMLARDPAKQLTYYQPGAGTLAPIGTMSRLRAQALKTLDAATAWMLHRHVGSAYRFLMAHYRKGDRVFAFGFSRGAYAARVLCGMLTKVGLLHDGLDEMVAFAWDTYANEMRVRPNATFKQTFARRVDVAFLGLFDTVSAVGTAWRPRAFPYTATNPRVAQVRHAIALDERRAAFVQNLWRPARGEDVRQVWFAGVHSDVGGGYPDGENQLARIPLAWMLREAQDAGLKIDPVREERLLHEGSIDVCVESHATAPAHESLTRRWRAYEYLPIPRWAPTGDGGWTRRWQLHRGRARFVAQDALIHSSVRERMRRAPGYAPPNLPRAPTFVD